VPTTQCNSQDDVADAAQWASHFSAARIIHAADVTPATRDAEHVLSGSGPWALPHEGEAAAADGDEEEADAPRPARPGDDVLLLHVPGHTAGSCALLHKPSASLFTGDTLAFSAGLGRLTVFRRFNWHSLALQLASVRALEAIDFLHLLPGHGRRVAFESTAAKNAALHHMFAAEAEEEAAQAHQPTAR
jgi:glyoxylase-like metal-dependent hydrolase (beta-lactamase superfamily II)